MDLSRKDRPEHTHGKVLQICSAENTKPSPKLCKNHSRATAPCQSHCPVNRSVNHRVWTSISQRTLSKHLFVQPLHVYAVPQAHRHSRKEWGSPDTQPVLTFPCYVQWHSWSFCVKCIITLISPCSQLQRHTAGDFDLQPTRGDCERSWDDFIAGFGY